MAQNMHFHSEREKIEQIEEILGQSKMDDQQVQLQTKRQGRNSHCLVVGTWGPGGALQSCQEAADAKA